jgi:hypothetical protein
LELVSTELVGCSKTKKKLCNYSKKKEQKTQDYNNNFLWGNVKDKNYKEDRKKNNLRLISVGYQGSWGRMKGM